MRYHGPLAAAALLALTTAGMAQTQTPPPAETPPAAPAAPAAPEAQPAEKPAIANPEQVNPNAPVKGANSFTEEQARKRITEAGFTDVGALTLDLNGVWVGPAKKDGASVTVQMDYQGNIVSK